MLPTPRERDHKNAAATEQTALDRIDRGYGLDIAEAIQLLPTPRSMTGGGDNTAGQDRPSGHKGTTNLHGLIQDEFGVDLIGTPNNEPPADVPGGIVNMLPTPTGRDGKGVTSYTTKPGLTPSSITLPDLAHASKTDSTAWGKYTPAIERWAEVMDRPAPEPTDDKGRLNPGLVEWMMGYPEGWTEGVSRTGQLKALGNSIVPHQAAAAWGHLLGFNVATHTHTHTPAWDSKSEFVGHGSQRPSSSPRRPKEPAGKPNLLPAPTTQTYWGSRHERKSPVSHLHFVATAALDGER